MDLFSFVTHYLDLWGYWAIFIGMALESANIPIPSELIFGFAGFLVYLGRLDFWLATIYGVVGGLVGSILSYCIGYYGGYPFVLKYGKYLFITQKKVDFAQRWFDRYGLWTVFLGRLLPVIRTFISLPAGFARVSFVKFVIYTILGSIPWTITLIYLGRMLGANWGVIYEYGHQISIYIVVLMITIVFSWKIFFKHDAK